MHNPFHTFADASLLELAMTHASTGADENNERLEFLGDAVLDMIVADELYAARPRRSEGEMTEHKAWIVSRESLAAAARELDLEELASFGHGMSQRQLPRSVLANLYEAYLGAVYLDAGLEAARKFAVTTLRAALDRVADIGEAANPKQELQRRTQLATGEPPEYELITERGHAHAKAFLVSAKTEGREFPSAWGRTRKEAERWAAHEALLVLDAELAEATAARNGSERESREERSDS